jgi:Lrp/AsnC family leucine-responsive transcriptional regulator
MVKSFGSAHDSAKPKAVCPDLRLIAAVSPEERQSDMPNDRPDLDRYDRAILRILSVDGRISATELARRVGLTKSPVQARLKRLEETGVITGYRAQLDPIRMGLAHVAFVEVRLSDTREAALQAFNRAVLAVPEIEECHMIASRFDYLLKVRTADIQDYRRVLAERISALPHVAQTSTYVAMESVREGGGTAAI